MGTGEVRGKVVALIRETEKERRQSGSSEMIIRQETAAHCEMILKTLVPKQHVNIRETLSSLDQRKERERETTGDRAIEISIKDVQQDTMRTDEDSAYPRVTDREAR
ncbi:uncharacterized protein MONOS_14544 [Monocercomonoides exilis]|uniref:uncharacterized protein n=1 Tax=Monocercomonoides exilis TaxID=2049356 RepID=UPI003559C186|nr:hypothetical protein MONOS_14544 [Monocercomonoides exilis]|eukprot:MONOS_14544.1-p1 / transcript=MONOS_14544.1 / gene=MONOS_14544 / organism=Monocercomonoides_exilis_PA203 / gene_product=unspecified product / transcript_product=unspecified product / location=Mono_scaffold01021:11956-12276(-) / protein_length=107 / sequence_SO=supercontig / SO=protein_coding / is_pseudo=false